MGCKTCASTACSPLETWQGTPEKPDASTSHLGKLEPPARPRIQLSSILSISSKGRAVTAPMKLRCHSAVKTIIYGHPLRAESLLMLPFSVISRLWTQKGDCPNPPLVAKRRLPKSSFSLPVAKRRLPKCSCLKGDCPNHPSPRPEDRRLAKPSNPPCRHANSTNNHWPNSSQAISGAKHLGFGSGPRVSDSQAAGCFGY